MSTSQFSPSFTWQKLWLARAIKSCSFASSTTSYVLLAPSTKTWFQKLKYTLWLGFYSTFYSIRRKALCTAFSLWRARLQVIRVDTSPHKNQVHNPDDKYSDSSDPNYFSHTRIVQSRKPHYQPVCDLESDNCRTLMGLPLDEIQSCWLCSVLISDYKHECFSSHYRDKVS